MSLRLLLIGLAVAMVLLSPEVGNSETVCTDYGNSVAVEDVGGNGPACLGTGPGCRECVTTASRGVKICYWSNFDEAVYCYYGGQYPDNQIG